MAWLLSNMKYLALLLGLLFGLPVIGRRRERLGLDRMWQVLLTGIGFT